jgi:histidinol-phosphate phosphatase family protein
MPSTQPTMPQATARRRGAVALLSHLARRARRRRSDAILFDREGALVSTLPTSGDPDEVRLRTGAAAAVARARAAGVAVAVVTSKADENDLPAEDGERVNARVDELVGQADVWVECPHDPEDDCPCRKPAPGLIYLAAAALGTRPERCLVVGDVAADVEAAEAAGARAVLVPSTRTSPEDLEAAPAIASSLDEAVAIALGEAA